MDSQVKRVTSHLTRFWLILSVRRARVAHASAIAHVQCTERVVKMTTPEPIIPAINDGFNSTNILTKNYFCHTSTQIEIELINQQIIDIRFVVETEFPQEQTGEAAQGMLKDKLRQPQVHLQSKEQVREPASLQFIDQEQDDLVACAE